MKSFAQILSGIALTVALGTQAAYADPITVATGTVVAQMRGGVFALNGDDFSVSGTIPEGFSSPALFQCEPCSGADRLSLDLNSFASFQTESGAAQFGTTTYAPTKMFGVFTFTSPFNAFSSASVDPGSGVSPLEPFTFSGELLGYPGGSDAAGGAPLFYTQLTGSGFARAHFTDLGGGQFSADDITYEFSAPAAATPEPGSLLLLGSGLAGLARLRRRGRPLPRKPIG